METEVTHEHFVARLVVERVQHKRDSTKTPSYRNDDVVQPTERVVDELTSVTVKQTDLEDLKKKLAAHIELIDDLEN